MLYSYLLITKAISLWVVPHFTYISSFHSTADSNETKSNAVNIWTKNDSKHFNGAKISNVTDTEIKRRPGYVGDVWKRSFISTVWLTVHTNPSRKRSISKTLFKPEVLERKTFWKRSSKTLASRNHLVSLTEFSSNPKWSVIGAFVNFSGVKWTKNIWSISRVKLSFLNYSSLYGRNIIVFSPYYVWHLWEFIFRFVFTILLQFTTQEVREKTIKEQENLYNSEMLRYDQRRISPHNVSAMLSVKLARIKRIVNYKTLSWCIAEFSDRMLKKCMEVSKETEFNHSSLSYLPRTKLLSSWRKPENSR